MLRSKFDSESTIVIKCSVYAATELVPLLKQLKLMGSIGSSRAIKIEDWDGENGFGFDGDGPSSIKSIELNGALVKSKAKTVKASCGDELEAKLKKEGLYIEDKKKKPAKAATMNPKELALGIKVEMEHTKDKKIARQIALLVLALYR